MTNFALTRTSDVSARVVATLGIVLGLTIFSGDAAEASLINFISVSSTCVNETHSGVNSATGPVAFSFGTSPCADPTVPYLASASASSTVDYGVMKTSGAAAATGATGFAYASVTPTLASIDRLTFVPGDPTLSGQPGTVAAQMQLQALIPGPGYFELTVSDSGIPPGTWTDTWSTFDGFDCSALCTFDFSFPIIFDTPSPLVIKLVASVAAGVCCTFASFDLSHSVYSDGIQSISGRRSTRSLYPDIGFRTRLDAVELPSTNGSVPEPATLALLGIGLAGLRFSRRRQ